MFFRTISNAGFWLDMLLLSCLMPSSESHFADEKSPNVVEISSLFSISYEEEFARLTVLTVVLKYAMIMMTSNRMKITPNRKLPKL